ncbi:MAG: hypothetical protein HN929_01690 [Chloroflexi bacterium]|jgi:hypothetical protein|nr:hypothetical protein [Chloroflexota bacterium]
MGYETKLIIGKATSVEFEENDTTEIYFNVFAEIDLCKCGHDSPVTNIDWGNYDNKKVWYFYGHDGNTHITEDFYGDRPKPVPVSVVLAALREAAEEESYRRFDWAIALLSAMEDDPEELEVLFFGH